MIKKLLSLLFFFSLLYSCGSSQKIVRQTPKKKTIKKTVSKKPSLADKVVWTAVSYKGIPYRYGGMNKNGMDCSGLIYVSFKKRNINLPRTSRLMYAEGFSIPLNKIKRGDLLFFNTSRRGRNVNHVGLVTSAKRGSIQFIHSTSSKGVLVSYLRENYWKRAFIKAKRVID
ncbi:Cell wall-associated hydrolase, NlpC family [Tenacibaculum sp. MAR_2009_124]|uniref:C40 family peptidase n=1 Tax=Tenacibaculum sp. MAR_2009_124 TaxID=1250059 RepID=UPI0008968107|nr:C40 family peptidase [Tenacibaculum sp. MAR_2009_124]SEB94566.1 Cell wall-associated hydrolase, NlpC family [Tenacibaculum sp. MAR_2009_124]